MKKYVLILGIIAVCVLNSVAQQWEPVQNTVEGKIKGGYVVNGELFVFSMDGSGVVIYKKQNDDFIITGRISESFEMTYFNSILTFTEGGNNLYIVIEVPNKNELRIYKWDGKTITNITPASISINKVISAVWYDGKLFISGNKLSDTSSFVVQWSENNWKGIITPPEFWGPGNLFILKNILYCMINDSYSGSTTFFSFDGSVWKKVLSSNTGIQDVYSVLEYKEQLFIFDGTTNRYFLFAGNSLSEKSCRLKFDNYGSTRYCMISYHDKLFLGGQFWSEIEESPCVISFNGKKWSSAGSGISTCIRSFAVYEDNLYIFGELEMSGDNLLKNIARYKE